MLQLILKDFRSYWKFQLFTMAFLLTISILFIYLLLKDNGNPDPEMIIYFMIMLISSSMVSLLFIGLDEIYKTDKLFASLPVKRSQMVLAKYATATIQILMALVIHFIGVQIGALLQGGNESDVLDSIYQPILWLVMGIIVLIFYSFSSPILYRFGFAKGLLIIFIINFLMFISFIAIMINFNNVWADIQYSLEWGLKQPIWLTLLLLISLLLLIMKVSIRVSISIFNKRDI